MWSFFLLAAQLPEGVDPNITLNYMFLGYAAMWLVALLYIASLASRQHNLHKEIKLLQQLLEEDKES
jgi:CcmD family protein